MERILSSVVTFGLAVGLFTVVAVGGVAADDVTVEVTVIDQNNNTVGNADLTATWDGGESTGTTTSGGLALLEVPEGADVEISVDHPAYVRNRPHTIENAAVSNGADRLAAEIRVSVAGTAEITVRDSGSPVEGARVYALEEGEFIIDQRTDADGTVTTDRIEQRLYNFTITNPEYLTEEATIDVDGDITETIQIERGSVNVDFEVTDDHFDPPRPVEGANIELERATLRTDEDGQRSTDLRVNRRYDVTISKDGYEEVEQQLRVRESDTSLNAVIQRTRALNFRADNQRVVIGETTRLYVTNEYSEAIESATITRDGEPIGETNSNGQLVVEIPSDGDHTFTASANARDTSVTIEGIEPSQQTQAEPTEDEGSDGVGPGFGVVAGLVALLSVALLSRRRL